MKQKGFIQTPLLIGIVISIVVISAVTTGVVLYKQSKSSSLVASVSRTIQQDQNVESGTELEHESEELQSDEDETILEELQPEETGKDASQQEQELEQARLEAKIARQEAEVAKAETERLKVEQEAQRITEEQQRQKELRQQQEAERLAEEQRQQKIERQKEAERLKAEQERLEELRIQELQRLEEEERRRQEQLQQELDALEKERAELQARKDRALPVMEAIAEWIAEANKHLLYLEEEMEKAQSKGWTDLMLMIINQYEDTTEMIDKLNTIGFKLDDYINDGTMLSAEDRTFLSSLGISF